LPEGDVTLAVEYSTVNYKDALAIANASPSCASGRWSRGIDGAAPVEESAHPLWKKGDKAFLTAGAWGEGHWGCLAQKDV